MANGYAKECRRKYIEMVWPTLTDQDLLALHNMLIHGRPDGMPEHIWVKLRSLHLCDGANFYSAGGVRAEYFDLIEEKFASANA